MNVYFDTSVEYVHFKEFWDRKIILHENIYDRYFLSDFVLSGILLFDFYIVLLVFISIRCSLYDVEGSDLVCDHI